MCQFCGYDENISHLLFSCPLARYNGNIASCAFGFKNKPRSVQHLFGTWIKIFPKKNRSNIYVGAAAILWSIWKTRYNACFRSIRPVDPLAVINMVYQMMSSWAILHVKEPNCIALSWGAKLFVRLSSEAFRAAQGWRPAVQRLTG